MEANPFRSPESTAAPLRPNVVPYESGHLRAMTTVILLAVCACCAIVSAGSDVMQIGLLGRMAAGAPVAEAEIEANDLREMGIGLLQAGFTIATAISMVMWYHRAHRNLPALGATDLEFTPGWAVGWWFVPIANLWKPFQVTKEIWFGSDPERSMANVKDWEHHASTGPIGLWWAAWIISNIVDRIASRIALRAETSEQLTMSSYAMFVANVISVVAAALAIAVVLKLDRAQTARFEAMSGARRPVIQ